MSSASSISSQPPVAYTPPVANNRPQVARAPAKDDAAAEKVSAKVADLTATAVKAQAIKEAGTGAVLDIQA